MRSIAAHLFISQTRQVRTNNPIKFPSFLNLIHNMGKKMERKSIDLVLILVQRTRAKKQALSYLGAPLPHNDGAGLGYLISVDLYPEPFPPGIPSVLCAPGSLLMRGLDRQWKADGKGDGGGAGGIGQPDLAPKVRGPGARAQREAPEGRGNVEAHGRHGFGRRSSRMRSANLSRYKLSQILVWVAWPHTRIHDDDDPLTYSP